ncbi:MAG: hypothetical protein IRZ01_01365 [Thermoflavifilum aggregans]|nr:hypothetical protein [Thermoflavifilum aggregans]
MIGCRHFGWMLLLGILPVIAHAAGQPGRKSHTAQPVPCEQITLEKLMLMYPGFTPASPACEKQGNLPASVLRFYSWYLKRSQQQSSLIRRQEKEQPDLLPPFDVQWTEIEQYVEYLKQRYPELDTLHFS